MTTFRLYIDLGNDAMRTRKDLADALEGVIAEVLTPRRLAPFAETAADDFDGDLLPGWYQTIFDVNGNDVGRYAVKDGSGAEVAS